MSKSSISKTYDSSVVRKAGQSGGLTIIGGTASGEAVSLVNNSVDLNQVNLRGDGVLDTNTPNYETFLSNNNDIPNKKYVDDSDQEARLALIEHAGTGLNSGGVITQTGINEYAVSAGSGYISNNISSRVRVTWNAMSGLIPLGDGINYIRINDKGELDVTLDPNYDVDAYIELGYLYVGGAGTIIIEVLDTPKYNSKFTSRVNDWCTLGVKALIESGTGISEQEAPNFFKLYVASGVYHANMARRAFGATTSFVKMFNTTDYSWLPNNTPETLNMIDANIYNDPTQPAATALKPLTPGYWKTDILFRVPSGNVYLIYGQTEYPSLEVAKAAPLATIPASLTNVAILLAKITVQQGATSISSTGLITDIRPYLPRVFGFGSASAGSVQSHSALTGLTADDHPQYYNEVRGDLRYAPVAKGVSGGDAHAHVGGQGAQIDYTSLSSLPTLGTASALNFATSGDASLTEVVKGDDTRLTDARTPIAHGNEAHNVTFITASSAVAPNAPIAGNTKTKITYDAKGLVTSGTDATTADIADSADKRYVTDANLTTLNNTSGINTGDEITGDLVTTSTGNLLITGGVDAVIGSGTTIALSPTPEVVSIDITSLAVDSWLNNDAKDLTDYTTKAWNFNKTVYDKVKDPTGFSYPNQVVVTYNTDRTITITGTTECFWRGKLVTAIYPGWISEPHPDEDGYWYLKYNESGFYWSQTIWGFYEFQIASVHYSVLAEKFGVVETHGFMPWTVHKELHNTIGTYVDNGGDLSGIVLNSTALVDRRPDVSSCTLADEDLYVTNQALASKLYTHHWLEGTGDLKYSTDNSDILPLSGNQPYYNKLTGAIWTRELMPANTYQAIWLVALPVSADTASQKFSYIWVIGQSVDTSLTVINALRTNDMELGNIINSAEFVGVQKIVIYYDGVDWTIISTHKLPGTKVSQMAEPIGVYLTMTECDDITINGDGTDFDPLHVIPGVFVHSAGLSGGQIIKGGLLTTESLALYNNTIDSQGLHIEQDGTISSNVASYESLITADNDFTNKKYVNDQDNLLVKLNGRSGGQIINGGTASGQNLHLLNNSVNSEGIIVTSSGLVVSNNSNYTNLVTSTGCIVNKGYVDDTVFVPLQQNIEMHGTGLVSGGAFTITSPTSPIAFNVTAGIGYISNNTTDIKRITWDTVVGAATLGDGINYIRINNLGQLDLTLDPNYSIDDYIELGYIFVGGNNTIVIEMVQAPKYVSKFPNRVSAWCSYGVRALVQTGTGVTENLTPLTLKVSSGILHVNLDIINLNENTVFTKMMSTTDMGWIPVTYNAGYVDPGFYNDTTQPAATALVPMTSGYWKKDLIFRTPTTGNVYLIYGQAQYATQEEADGGPLPNVPDSLANVAVFLATITCQSTDTSIGNRLKDIRPYLPRVFGFGSSTSGTTTRHGDLAGLSEDDHTQYFNEARGDLRYAKLANGVTNGDTHDHSGGDGGTISYNNLADKPFIPVPVVAAKYILQEPYTGLDNAQALSTLGTGIVKNTTATGVLSIASAGVDYLAPNTPITAATKTKITYNEQGFITSGADATTADISDSSNRRYVTDAQLVVIGNTSGINSGNVSLATNHGLALINQVIGMGTPSTITSITTNSVSGATHTHALTLPAIPTDISSLKYIIQTADALIPNAQAMGALGTGIVKNTTITGVQSIAQAGTDYVAPNAAIVAGTGTKVSYDTKGLVTGSTAATTADINDSTNRRYLTDAQLTVVSNTSGINSGDETALTLGATIAASSASATPIDADKLPFSDPNASNIVKHYLWSTIKSSIATYITSLVNTWSAKQTFTSNVAMNTNVGFVYSANVPSSGVVTINWNLSNKQKLTLTGNVTTMSFTAPTNGACNLVLSIIQDGTGGRTVAFPAGIKWASGLTPTITTTADKTDIVNIFFDGSTYFCAAVQNF